MKMSQTVQTVATFTGIVYLVCAFFVLIAPQAALRFFDMWFHVIYLAAIANVPTLSEVIFGFFTAVIAASLGAALFVKLWNTFGGKQ